MSFAPRRILRQSVLMSTSISQIGIMPNFFDLDPVALCVYVLQIGILQNDRLQIPRLSFLHRPQMLGNGGRYLKNSRI
jgi:hypothetical protein